MTDQIVFQGPYCANERSAITITARFRDAGADSTPTNVYWRLDDAESRCQVQDWTSLTPDTEVSIPISAGNNAILNRARPAETKVLTVMADRDLDTQFTASYRYELRNQPWQS